MILHATVSASPHDPFHEMALIYRLDKSKDYCFSLTRRPDSSEIEIMVVDQVNEKIDTLAVDLYMNKIQEKIHPEQANKLDGHEKYIIEFQVDDLEFKNISAALEKIFDGKLGLTVHDF
ncbi:hypothetical protein QCD60_18860 [Pokkaliibacter sp. MBI-7]|uniref:hypothetical protein n=1 Tax=Pokkaliibacter sp. MBI-7 TaxID=3040600 RepID=UPI00244B94FA|nr:hypothetical protein [Pokkaliibacter sp. MBI-7]MDH2434608.1 hypothetical protein [Pokkaliibacter sp. MBI-7]